MRKLPKQYLGAFTTAQRNGITSPNLHVADLILNTTLEQYEYWNGSAWVPIGGFVGGFLEYTMDMSYGTNKTGVTFLHLPEGFFYPIGFNLIDRLYINGVEVRKGVDWEECPWPIPGAPSPWKNVADNFNFVNERARIAWGVRLLHGAVNEDDDYRMVWRVRVVPYAPSMRPIAVTAGGEELWDGTKYHDSHNPPPPIGNRKKTTAIAVDGRSDYQWLLWRKPRRCSVFGLYEKVAGSGKPKHHQGRGFRPYRLFENGKYFMPETQPISNYEWKGRFGYKVSYYDTINGAIGILSAETARRVGKGQVPGGRPEEPNTYLID